MNKLYLAEQIMQAVNKDSGHTVFEIIDVDHEGKEITFAGANSQSIALEHASLIATLLNLTLHPQVDSDKIIYSLMG